MIRARRKFSKINHLSVREKAQADNAWNRCEPFFEETSQRLGRLELEGISRHSKSWRGHYLSEVYRFVLSLLEQRDVDMLKQDFYLMAARESNNPEQRNLFNLAIQAFETDHPFGISKQSRSEYANALAYAWKHSIPHQLVWGFILQIGGVKKAAKKQGQVDTMEDWARTPPPWETYAPLN
ncbi:hypothetical protein P8R33_03775 [Qipengyuania sp. XHP0211]|uniref:hypothetical protein n=1 Tax=Qipengyuania sp. XHP0211 TaxID=3038079 RepID=UPI00241F8C3F|nr:hypothetical protein [Qipengyuania sp. XHP0211]MDG5750218.1 hypothetical protein [Qipengyuania sp. XHP0211]